MRAARDARQRDQAGAGAEAPVMRARALINLAAIERNCARLKPSADVELCAVVKADGYGHGAVPCAGAALAGGASRLAVATAQEALELREARIRAPIIVMGALTRQECAQAVGCGADVVAWSEQMVSWAVELGGARMHVKFDSGMGRLGTRDAALADHLLTTIEREPRLELAGLMTHFATADQAGDDEFFDEQLRCFTAWTAGRPGVLAHAANSAATLRDPRAHFGMVRCGVGIYGLDPFGGPGGAGELEPALELESWVAAVKPCLAGESAGYGRRFIATRDTFLGVVPVGYGDGVRRGLTNNADVLIGGRRHPLVGTVSMDNVTVDLGPDTRVQAGARAVLLGGEITAEELAERLSTINYEITCGLAARVPRVYHRDGVPA